MRNNAQGRHLTITAENECRKLHCSLRDLASLLQALGRLAEHFIGEKFLERFTDGTMLLERWAVSFIEMKAGSVLVTDLQAVNL